MAMLRIYKKQFLWQFLWIVEVRERWEHGPSGRMYFLPSFEHACNVAKNILRKEAGIDAKIP